MPLKYKERIVSRYEIAQSSFVLLAFMFSDENLSNEFVMKQLKLWQTKEEYSLVLISKKDVDILSFFERLHQMLPVHLLQKITKTYEEDNSINSTVQEKIVCYKCKNVGSIISSRLSQNPIRFVCEKCEQYEEKQTQPISDLIWTRRCNECSNSQANSYLNTIKNIKNEMNDILKNEFESIPAMMTVKKDDNLNLITLISLFTIKEYRKKGLGEKLIRFIPFIANNYSISICTAGLESEFLFSKFL